jgi:hypothetical protein
MKSADLPGSAATAPNTAQNGKHRAAKKNGAGPKRSAGSGATGNAPLAPEPLAAPIATEAAPIDAPMWPVHSALWFQPELAPSAPMWSDLNIERHNRIPAPVFLHAETAPLNRPDALDHSIDARTPGANPEIPQSGLAPLGWDPRADCGPAVSRQVAGRKEECE